MTRTKIEQIKFDNNLKPYFNIQKEDNKKIYICKKCLTKINNAYLRHYNTCNNQGTNKTNDEKLKRGEFKYSELCDMGCGQTSKFYYKTGKAYCCKLGAKCPVKVAKDKLKKDGINPWKEKEHPKAGLGKAPWCKGLTKETSETLKNSGKKISASLTEYKKNHKFTHAQETKDKLSKIAFAGNYGGYQQGSGYGKKGWYKGYFCDSSWELAYVIYCLDHAIPIKRNKDIRKYHFKNKEKNYHPDFIIYEGSSHEQIIEIKGYHSAEADAKSLANPDVLFLYEEDLTDIFTYVKGKYGKNYIELYEKK